MLVPMTPPPITTTSAVCVLTGAPLRRLHRVLDAEADAVAVDDVTGGRPGHGSSGQDVAEPDEIGQQSCPERVHDRPGVLRRGHRVVHDDGRGSPWAVGVSAGWARFREAGLHSRTDFRSRTRAITRTWARARVPEPSTARSMLPGVAARRRDLRSGEEEDVVGHSLFLSGFPAPESVR